jgi:hypothetical protein
MRFSALTAVAVAAIVAGCGGSTSTSTSVTTTGSTVSSTIAAVKPPSFVSVGNCEQLDGIVTAFAQALQAGTSGGKLRLHAAISASRSLADSAPSEIHPDLRLMAQTFSILAAALAKAGYTPGRIPTASQVAVIQAASQPLNLAKLRAAEHHVARWWRQNCEGI